MSYIKRILAVLTALCMMLTVSSCAADPTYVDMTIMRGEITLDFFEGPTEYTIEQLSEEADIVVLADVNGIFLNDQNIQLVELTVKETWKGKADKTIIVNDTGTANLFPATSIEGVDLNETTRDNTLMGEPIMRRGNRVILFLQKDEEFSYYYVSGGIAGKFFYDQDGTYHNCLMYGRYYEQYKSGEKLPPGVDYLSFDEMTPKTKRELKRIVKSAQ